MLTIDHFKRPFIDTVLESIKVIDESTDQDVNDPTVLNTKMYSV